MNTDDDVDQQCPNCGAPGSHRLLALAAQNEKLRDTPTISLLEAQVNERWGTSQFDWTIGKCPEGWFFYCGTGYQPNGKIKWGHKGYAPTLTAVLQAMLEIEEPA